MKQEKDCRLSNKNFGEACKNAFNGIKYAIISQKNIKIQLLIAIIVLIGSLVLKVDIIEMLFLCFAIFLVLFAEMVNTAIETVVDLCTEKYNAKAKVAKDVAAGAVVVTAFNSIVTAALIFIKYVY